DALPICHNDSSSTFFLRRVRSLTSFVRAPLLEKLVWLSVAKQGSEDERSESSGGRKKPLAHSVRSQYNHSLPTTTPQPPHASPTDCAPRSPSEERSSSVLPFASLTGTSAHSGVHPSREPHLRCSHAPTAPPRACIALPRYRLEPGRLRPTSAHGRCERRHRGK